MKEPLPQKLFTELSRRENRYQENGQSSTLILSVGLNNDELPLSDGVQLLNRRVFVKNYFVMANEVDDDFGVGRQPEKIVVTKEDHIQLIIVPHLLVEDGIEINYECTH